MVILKQSKYKKQSYEDKDYVYHTIARYTFQDRRIQIVRRSKYKMFRSIIHELGHWTIDVFFLNIDKLHNWYDKKCHDSEIRKLKRKDKFQK